MKKILFALLLSVFVLAGCSPKAPGTSLSQTKEDLKITLYLDKRTYTSTEVITPYAEVEYVGKEDKITLITGSPSVYFSVTGGKYHKGEYAIEDMAIMLELKKNTPVRFDFSKSGGFETNSPDAPFWEAYYAQKELMLEPGTYDLEAGLIYRLQGEPQDTTLKVKMSITVTQ